MVISLSLQTTTNSSTDKLKQRQERFIDEKLKKRQERFGVIQPTTVSGDMEVKLNCVVLGPTSYPYPIGICPYNVEIGMEGKTFNCRIE